MVPVTTRCTKQHQPSTDSTNNPYDTNNDNNSSLHDNPSLSPSSSTTHKSTIDTFHNTHHSGTPINPVSYLNDISHHLLSLPSDQPSFEYSLRYEHLRSILRILLRLPSKTTFSQLVRVSRNELEFETRSGFLCNVLDPLLRTRRFVSSLLLSSSDGSASNVTTTTTTVNNGDDPDWSRNIHYMEEYLKGPPSRGSVGFDRIASGRRYRGIVLELLRDAASRAVEKEKEKMVELEKALEEAVVPPSEEQVLLRLVDILQRNNNNNDNNNNDNEGEDNGGEGETLDPIRIRSAQECIRHFCSLPSTIQRRTSSSSTKEGTRHGKECERDCIEYLLHRCCSDGNKTGLRTTRGRRKEGVCSSSSPPSSLSFSSSSLLFGNVVLLPNVNVVIKLPRRIQQQQQQQSKGRLASFLASTPSSIEIDNTRVSVVNNAIIRTTTVRERSCMEFDAILVRVPSSSSSFVEKPPPPMDDQNNDHNDDHNDDHIGDNDKDVVNVIEVWEAKYTIGPWTLRDAIEKKLVAVRNILNDNGAALFLDDGRELRLMGGGGGDDDDGIRERKREGGNEEGEGDTVEGNVGGNEGRLEQQQEEEDGKGNNKRKLLTFGIYGTEILPPSKAIRQLIPPLALDALSKGGPEYVIKVMKDGYVVEVGKDVVRDHLDSFRKTLDGVLRDVDVDVVVEIAGGTTTTTNGS